jgi:hypothetical protein
MGNTKKSLSNAKKSLVVLGIVLILPFVAQIILATYWNYVFEKNCGDWLKMAADANSVQIASERLDKAVSYIESHGLTKGSAAVLLSQPTNDLEPWYQNLKQAQQNLHEFPQKSTKADISTALVKLRETLLDHKKDGDSVTCPYWAFIYPYQVIWVVSWFLTTIAMVVGVLCLIVASDPLSW